MSAGTSSVTTGPATLALSQGVEVCWRRVARAFSRPVFAEVARTGSDFYLRQLLVEAGFDSRLKTDEMLHASLKGLERSYRCEYVYKAAIADRIVFGRHSPRTASLHVELPVGKSIVDVAVFNGTSTAYEIKTELDSDRRLTSQTSDYFKVFERVFVVTHPSMVGRYSKIVDSRVGILSLTSGRNLSVARQASSVSAHRDQSALFAMLRSAEYRQILSRRFGAQPELSNGQWFDHYLNLWMQLPSDDAHGLAVAAMRARTTTQPIAAFLNGLPAALRAVGYATPLSAAQRMRVLKAFL